MQGISSDVRCGIGCQRRVRLDSVLPCTGIFQRDCVRRNSFALSPVHWSVGFGAFGFGLAAGADKTVGGGGRQNCRRESIATTQARKGFRMLKD